MRRSARRAPPPRPPAPKAGALLAELRAEVVDGEGFAPPKPFRGPAFTAQLARSCTAHPIAAGRPPSAVARQIRFALRRRVDSTGRQPVFVASPCSARVSLCDRARGPTRRSRDADGYRPRPPGFADRSSALAIGVREHNQRDSGRGRDCTCDLSGISRLLRLLSYTPAMSPPGRRATQHKFKWTWRGSNPHFRAANSWSSRWTTGPCAMVEPEGVEPT